MSNDRRRKSVSKLILRNLSQLVESADLLAHHRKYGPVIHLAMAAREEAVNWLVLYCWDYLDQRVKGQIYNHILKHELAGLFYYLSGKIQVTEFACAGLALLACRDPKLRKSVESVVAHMWTEFHRYDPSICLGCFLSGSPSFSRL